MKFKAYPMTVGPILKEKIWGGQNLKKFIDLRGRKKVGEAWMLADQSENNSVVSNGYFKGLSMRQLIKKYAGNMLGKKLVKKYGEKFPLLFKYLDTNDRISIQVHPDDKFAAKRGYPAGKTEMWYVLGNKFRSALLVGFKKWESPRSLAKIIEKGQLEKKLRQYRPKKGESYFIPAGTAHTIGRGNVIFEIQQNSDITYRMYDWKRQNLSADRHLNITDAIGAVKFDPAAGRVENRYEEVVKGVKLKKLARCEYFAADELKISRDIKYWYNRKAPIVIAVIEGEADIITGENEHYRFLKGNIVFIPFEMTGFLVKVKKKTRLIVTEAR